MAFVSAYPTINRASQSRICRRRPSIVASTGSDMGNPSVNSPNYNLLGSGFQAKGLQTIEFRIRQNGTVEEKVTGVRGSHCEKLTEKLEEAVGEVVHVEQTGEYYENVEVNVAKNPDKSEPVTNTALRSIDIVHFVKYAGLMLLRKENRQTVASTYHFMLKPDE
ncbi:hypothetical protein BWQ96_02271 [Gracilariopsis chorda]|uniref:DUF2997 domain-containing protein n=1 Tax=Gracilariopsis chorda TaxID=448386 RepID=A0A2V3J0M9_9FLOR|nr:hypothetical protein BWQ96_02271 [Gracilariopsis chorda]|eukprot:PXF47885.1 hypothetical protein BWQ96_02271 [Gracilariopsis chorda]